MVSTLLTKLHSAGLLTLFLLTASLGWGQGFEDFTNSTAGSGYTDGSFIGNNGIEWTYVQSRDGDGDSNNSGINLPALMLRRSSDDSKITSSSIPNGIGDFSVKLYKGFTGGGNRQVELFVNGASQGTSSPFDDFNEHVFAVSGIDISGPVVIEIRNITSRQVIIDDITWTAFGTGGNIAPVISNITQTPGANNVTPSDAVSVSADLIDTDGIASAELRWGTTSGNLSTIILMTNTTGDTYATATDIPAQLDGTTIYYEIQATDSNASPLSTTSPEQSYTVFDPVYLTLPYINNLRTQTDYDDALNRGFGFSNTDMTLTGGGYVRIMGGGSIETPIIDFSVLSNLDISFDLTTYGGNTGQILSVFASNDNGATYVLVDDYPVPSAYATFEESIDLSTFNGVNGKLKFEMTAGTNSIRFRDLSLLNFQGFHYANGTWTPNDPSGISTVSDDIYIFNGTTSLTSSTTVQNVVVNPGATLNIESILTIAGDITNNGDMVFISSASANGELDVVPSSSTINGEITVQNFMSVNRAYRMVSSPVTTTSSIHDNWQEGAISNTDNPAPGFGTHITGTLIDQQNGFDATGTGNPSMFTVNVGNQVFEPIANTDVNTLDAGNPYLLFVRGDRSIDLTDDASENETVLRSKGTMFTGSNTQTYPGATAFGQFIMFGNPYQSVVDITSVFANSTNINSGFYYVYDPTLGDHGAYVTIDLSLPAANIYLQPGQAAQVATMAAGTTSIVFGETDKAPGNFVASSVNGLTADNSLSVQLFTEDNFANGGPLHDSFEIVFAQGNDNSLTPEDAVKPSNFYENLGIDLAGTLLSIENRDMPQPGEVFNMFTNGYKHEDYVMKFEVNGLNDVFLFLDDKFTNSSVKLEVGENAYPFTVDSTDVLSIATDRFSIRTEQILGVENNDLFSGIQVYPNPFTGNTFYINAPKLEGEKLNISITDLTGRNIFEQSLDCRSNTITIALENELATGIYLVSINHNGEEQTFRLIKK